MLILDMMLPDYDDGFSVQRSSIISTDFPKHLLSIAKNIVVCNKTRKIGAVAEWSGVLFIGTEVEQRTSHDADTMVIARAVGGFFCRYCSLIF